MHWTRRRASERGGLPLIIVLALLGTALLVTVGYLFQERLAGMERQLAKMGDQVEELAQGVEESTRRSEAALTRSREADERATEAARGRVVAERARADAERETRQAQNQAETARQEARLARDEAERIRRERQEELDRLQQALSQLVETRRTALGLVMNLGNESIQFDFDKSTVRPENRELLSRIAGVLLTSKGYRIQVYGHTDDIGSDEYNLELSQRRAQAVSDYLTQAGIDPSIISTKGFGKTNPLVSGTSSAARQKNRRVEIGVVDAVVSYQRAVSRGNTPQ